MGCPWCGFSIFPFGIRAFGFCGTKSCCLAFGYVSLWVGLSAKEELRYCIFSLTFFFVAEQVRIENW